MVVQIECKGMKGDLVNYMEFELVELLERPEFLEIYYCMDEMEIRELVEKGDVGLKKGVFVAVKRLMGLEDSERGKGKLKR